MQIKPQNKVLPIFLLLLVLPGCVGLKNLKIGTRINKNGSGTRVVDFGLDKKIVASIEKEGKKKLEDRIRKRVPTESNIKISQKSNFKYYRITTRFKKVDEIPDLFRKLLKNNGSADITLRFRDRIFAVSYDLEEELNLKQEPLAEILPKSFQTPPDSLEVKYWISLPGEIRETNGLPTTANTAVWQLKAGKTYKIRAKSLYIRWWLVALTGIAFLLMVGLSGVLLINRKGAMDKTL